MCLRQANETGCQSVEGDLQAPRQFQSGGHCLWSEDLSLETSGEIKEVPVSKLAEWASEPWKKILEIIKKHFPKKC